MPQVHMRSDGDDISLARFRRVYHAGAPLFQQGDNDRGIHKIISGAVTVYRVTADGYRQIECFAGPGEYVSLCLSATSPTSAEALTAAVTTYLPRADFERRLLEDARFRADVFADIDKAATDARRQATLLARRCARQRVADFVLFLHQRFAPRPDGYTPIAMSRCDIADHLGLTVETVSRMLNQLKQAGLIDMPRPDRFSLIDRLALRRAAGAPRPHDSDGNGAKVETG